MKCLFNRKAMLDAMTAAAAVAPARSPKPILASVKLTASEDGATLQATDLEVGVRLAVLGVKVDTPGSAILPTQKVLQILKHSTDEDIALELHADNSVHVRGLRSKYALPSEDPCLFPEVPEFNQPGYHVLAAKDLRRALRRTSYATDPASQRYALGGIRFEPGEAGVMAFVATDGRRLSHQVVPCEAEGGPATRPAVVPLKAAKLLERLTDDDDPPVHVYFHGDTAMHARTATAEVYSRLVEGRYPRYQDVFPPPPEATIFVGVDQLLAVVAQASIATSEESRGIDFDFTHGSLKLTSKTADVGSADVDLFIDYSGKTIGLTLDPTYLADALKALDPAAQLRLEIVDAKTAFGFRTDDGFRGIVMPLTSNR